MIDIVSSVLGSSISSTLVDFLKRGDTNHKKSDNDLISELISNNFELFSNQITEKGLKDEILVEEVKEKRLNFSDLIQKKGTRKLSVGGKL